MRPNSINDCEASASPWTQRSSRHFLLSESASLTIAHTQSVSWLQETAISATMALFPWVTLQIKNILLYVHTWWCRSTNKKKEKSEKGWKWGAYLETPAVWHFWLMLSGKWAGSAPLSLRHEQHLWEIPKWGAIYSLTDEAGREEWATPERVDGRQSAGNLSTLRCVTERLREQRLCVEI